MDTLAVYLVVVLVFGIGLIFALSFWGRRGKKSRGKARRGRH